MAKVHTHKAAHVTAFKALFAGIKLLTGKNPRHFESIQQAFKEGALTRPITAMSDMDLAKAISEFTGVPPNEASISTLARRFNPRLSS